MECNMHCLNVVEAKGMDNAAFSASWYCRPQSSSYSQVQSVGIETRAFCCTRGPQSEQLPVALVLRE